MARSIWKGAIAFGLVHVPVALHPATHDIEVDFDWLDKRSMDPVGYKRVNKRTGKEIDREHIVKGVKQSSGDYVVIDDDEIRAAYPRSTQTIEIEAFVPAEQIPFVYLERPYYLEPAERAEKVYTLLREAMARESLVGIARLVLHTKEHLAALLPAGPALMLGTLRWTDEIRPADDLQLPPAGASSLKAQELTMATQLIREMSTPFEPQKFKDRFTDAIRALVDRKARAGDTAQVEPLEQAPPVEGGNVVDLTELLRKSLGQGRRASSSSRAASRGKAAASRKRTTRRAA
jgi:DNA end-binding protein Ku